MFRALTTILFWETLEGELRINCFSIKHFEIPRVSKNELSYEEVTLVDFLTNFGEENLNLKCIVDMDAEVARNYLD